MQLAEPLEHFISIDVGTTAIKVALVDRLGNVHGIVRRQYELETPRTDIVEMEADRYWTVTKESIAELLEHSPVERSSVRSIAISSQGETLIVVDREGRALRKAIVWLDNRSRRECEELREAVGLVRATGQNEVIPTWPATRILWLRRHEPHLFRRVHKFLLLEDYLLLQLTGEYVGELSLYSSSYMVDIRSGRWLPEILEFIEVDEKRLVSLREPGTEVAQLRRSLCEEFALPLHTRVVAGAMDQAASVVGAGGVAGDVVVETTGTVLSVCRTLDFFDEQATRSHPVHYHAMRGKYHSIDWCPTGGMSLGWLKDLLNGEPRMAEGLDELTAETLPVSPGSDGLRFFPFLSGLGTYGPPSKSHGAFFDIELHHGRAHFVKAVLESVGFLIRRSLGTSSASEEIDEIRSLGGGAASEVWNQLKADVTGKRIVTLESNESSSIGIAMVQAVAAGVYQDFGEAASRMVRTRRTYEPDSERARAYRDIYQEYWAALESTYFR